MDDKKLTIHIGATAGTIASQLKKQGFKFNKTKANVFQRCLEAITLLRFQDLLADNQYKIACDKLLKKIVSHIKQENK